jgi:FkbM family methyltransferase
MPAAHMSSRFDRLRRRFARGVVRRPALSLPRPTPNWQRYYGRELSDARDLARLEEFERLTMPTTLVWADGLSTRLIPGEQLSCALHVSGTYEPNTLCVLRRHLGPGGVFLDAGAHAGVVSLAASRWVGEAGHVYAFEPSEREYRRLLDSLELSRVSNVTPLRTAVGATPGSGSLLVADAPYSGLNTLGDRFAYGEISEASRETVEIVTIDDFVRQRAIARVDAIKLDVEGGEAAALVGAAEVLRGSRPVLVLELNAAALDASGATPARVEELLLAADYRAFAIDESDAGLTPVAGIAELDGQNVVFLPRETAGDPL